MYMPKVRTLCQRTQPNQENANLSFRVGGNANFSIFRYQHFGIANTKVCVGPNASSFVSQWNIGFTLQI